MNSIRKDNDKEVIRYQVYNTILEGTLEDLIKKSLKARNNPQD